MTAQIWLTAKTRMNTEERYKRYSTFYHLLFCYYSFLTIATSVFDKELSGMIPHLTQINIVISVALFSLSLIIYGFGFERLAASHRDCYLKLQSILASNTSDADKMQKYAEIMIDFPNHATRDYNKMLFEKIILHREKLTDSRGQDIPFGCSRSILTITQILLSYAYMIAAFAWPILIVGWSVWKNGSAS